MFRFSSSIASKSRPAKNSINQIYTKLKWSKLKNSGGQEIAKNDKLSRSLKDCGVMEEKCLPCGCASFEQQVPHPASDVNKNGINYFPVMLQAMCIKGRKVLQAGVSAVDLQFGMCLAVQVVEKYIKLRGYEEIAQIGTIAANGDRYIGELVAKAIEEVGEEGTFIISDVKKSKNKLEFLNRMKLNWGPVSSLFIDEKSRTCVLKNPLILIHENKISNKNIIKEAIGLACYTGRGNRHLLIVSDGIEEKVAASLALDRTCLRTKICVVKPPEFEEKRKAIMEDLAIFTRGRVVTGDSDLHFIPLMLGSCKEVTVSENGTVILGESGQQRHIEGRCKMLRSAINLSTSENEVKLLRERLEHFGRDAIFKVGGPTKAELNENNKRVANALNAAKAAAKEGVLPGGGVALLRASEMLDKLHTTRFVGLIGVKLLQNALKMPVYTIASSAGFDGSNVVKMLLEQNNPDLGFDPVRGEYVDMMKTGIVDPVKLVIKELHDVACCISRHCWCSDSEIALILAQRSRMRIL